jgi:hypothetical protein
MWLYMVETTIDTVLVKIPRLLALVSMSLFLPHKSHRAPKYYHAQGVAKFEINREYLHNNPTIPPCIFCTTLT